MNFIQTSFIDFKKHYVTYKKQKNPLKTIDNAKKIDAAYKANDFEK